MGRRYTKREGIGKGPGKEGQERQPKKGRAVQLVLDREELVAMMQDSLTDFATEMGLKVACVLLEELRERGLATNVPTLFVLDGSKALRAAVKRVWGRHALIQRCQAHKKRNVKAHLPQKHWQELSRQMNLAYHEEDYEEAVKLLKLTARWLDRISPDAAASLREGMEETLTVVRLGVPELLRKTLATTNPIESAFSVAENVTARVKRWRDGDMRKRWCTAGLLRAESKFRRVKGHRHMPQLLQALDRIVLGKELDEPRRIA